MSDNKPTPMIKVPCKVCGRTFVAELRELVENKGKLECSHCNGYHYYAFKDVTKIPN